MSSAATLCDGSSECAAELHIHGCFADRGKCDEPGEHPAATVLSRLWNELGEKEQRWISGDLERDVLAILSRRSVESESARLEAHYENALTRIANAAQTTGHRVMRDIARRALEESHV